MKKRSKQRINQELINDEEKFKAANRSRIELERLTGGRREREIADVVCVDEIDSSWGNGGQIWEKGN